jgi:hypothetical protein
MNSKEEGILILVGIGLVVLIISIQLIIAKLNQPK